MTLFSVFDRRRDEPPALVPDRFSWFAAVLPPVFAIAHGLWLAGLLWLGAVLVIGGLGLWLGPAAHLVHYPVRGGDDLNVVAVVEGGTERQGWNQPGSSEALLAGFTRWSKDSKSLLEQAGGWRSWSLYRLTSLRHWSDGSIALLGDAAHPVLPFLAQGAALAIEDAVTLASCLAERPSDPSAAFRRYEVLRQPRATRVRQ